MNLKRIAEEHGVCFTIFAAIYNTCFGGNRVKGRKGNCVEAEGVLSHRCKIVICGKENVIRIGKLSRLKDCVITIHGNRNSIVLGESVFLNQTHLHIEDNDNLIQIGDKSSIQGSTQLAVMESTCIKIGDECLLSGEINFRTGDSHSLLDNKGKRINPSKSIFVEDHIWIGTKVLVLKGSGIPSGCMIGAGSLINKVFDEQNCVIAGNPAKIVKRDIGWCHERI